MSYDSRIEGALALHPFPSADEATALREELAPLAAPGAGRLALTPLGHGLVFEQTLEWTEAITALAHARRDIFTPRGIALQGVLRAVGEDDTLLATITVDEEGLQIQPEGSDDDVDDVDEDDVDEDDVDEDDEDDEDLDEKASEWAAFRKLAIEEGLAAQLERLVELCVPSVRLIPRKRSKWKSRLGGLPDVPPGFVWPALSTGEPLAFVAQIDLAELREVGLPGAEALPERGALSFFHGMESSSSHGHQGNAGRVFFFDDPTLARAKAPKHPEFAALPSIALSLELQTEELPDIESAFYPQMLADEGPLPDDVYGAAAERFGSFVAHYVQRGVRDESERPVHRVLGYADPLQADVYACTEGNAAERPFDTWTSREHFAAASRWRLLLQVDSDPDRGLSFGDDGVLAFMIREEDLAARRFDRVWVDWQSH
jgi:uncharacterized protein YwqG